jgi:F-type H+-transporting ATPase subunit b
LEVLNALGINLGYLFVQIFNFLIMFVVLRAWAFTPIVNALENRRKSIEQGLEDARIAAEARANAEQEAEKILADAQAKASEVVREATVRAESVGKDVATSAESEAEKILEEARAEAEVERERVLSDVRGQIGALALAAAQRLLGEALDERRQHALIDAFFSGVKDGRVIVLEDAQLQGASAEITSALPLTESERETLKNEVLAKIGKQATVTFRVDPSILGGLIIRVGDKMVDNSIAGQLETLKHQLG